MTPTITAQFLTASRADLFALTKSIFESVNDDVFRDPANPLMVGVNGTMESGKKIISDAAVEYLFDKDTARLEGLANRDEYWKGRRGGHKFEIDYIDTAYQDIEGYSPYLQHDRVPKDRDKDEMQRYGEKIYLFMRQRTAGGINFLQNAHQEIPQPGLSLYIERSRGRIVKYFGARWLDTPLSARTEFQLLSNRVSWTRFVTIDVRDERLLNDKRFMADFRAYAPFCELKRPTTASVTNPPPTAVNLFGRDFPHPL